MDGDSRLAAVLIPGTRKRRRCVDDDFQVVQGLVEAWVWDAEVGTPLLDLPNELLEMVISRLPSYKDIAYTRTVCKKFNDVCVNVLRAGFKQIMQALDTSLVTATCNFERHINHLLLDPPRGYPVRFIGQRNLLRESDCLKQLQGLASQFRLLTASVWHYASAGVCTYLDGDLLDTYVRLKNQITATDSAGRMFPALKRTTRRCRRRTAIYIAKFGLLVESYLQNPANDQNLGSELTGVTFLEILECSVDAVSSTPIIVQESNDEEQRREYAQMTMKYSLPNCWFGMMSERDDVNTSRDNALNREVLSIIREMIWMSNNEYYSWLEVHSRMSLLQGSTAMAENQPFENVIFLRTSTTDINRPIMNIVDHIGDRAFFYGHRSNFRDPPTGVPNGAYDLDRQFIFKDRVINLPHFSDKVELVFNIKLVCKRDYIPKTIVTRAEFVESKFPKEKKRYSLEVHLESVEETSRWYRFLSDAVPETDKEVDDEEEEVEEEVTVMSERDEENEEARYSRDTRPPPTKTVRMGC